MIICGDALTELGKLPDSSVHCCVTSPPYWGLRDYGVAGQLGLEKTPEEYVAKMVAVFREVRRVLRDDGTAWINLGDSYSSSTKGDNRTREEKLSSSGLNLHRDLSMAQSQIDISGTRRVETGLKPKDLVGIPWRVAFALQADGWYLRSDIIWSKKNPMPESVKDRPTRAHEYIFLMSKSARYYYDAEAVAEEAVSADRAFLNDKKTAISSYPGAPQSYSSGPSGFGTGKDKKRNRRSVWTITTKPYAEAHFATFPPDLIEPCIKAGCPVGGVVLDPFFGAGTTGLVAARLGREFIGIELNQSYCDMARKRIYGELTEARP
jgi:DNA modification methylase